MGARLSSNNPKMSSNEHNEVAKCEASKRQKTSSSWVENHRLIPSLPNEISVQILARLPRIWHFKAKLVSRSWRAALMDEELYKIRKELGATEEWLYILTKISGNKLVWYALDPMSRLWQRLPLMPKFAAEDATRRGLSVSGFKLWNMVDSSVVVDAIRVLLGRKDSVDQNLFCGCAIGAVEGCLYVLGGFCKALAMNSVWRYNPVVNAWSEVTPMSIGRAYCKTSILNNKLYAVGGVSRGRGGLTPLQSAEVFDPCSGTWSDVPNMPFSKAQVLPTAFLADLLKPIATGMTSYRGKLYVPQSLYCWPFFVDVGGEVYDPETNSWVDMPVGMGEGWPTRQAGTKLGVIVDEELYTLDPSNSLDSARIKVYDYQDDAWKIIEGDIPIHDVTDSESPYLLAGFLGKLHVITKDVNNNILVMQADRQNRCNSSPSTSSVTLGESLQELSFSSENIWQVIASKRAGSAEIVSCQVLDI